MASLSLFARLLLDKTGFDAGIKAASNQVNKFGSDIKSAIASAFTFAALKQFVEGISTTVGRFKDLAEQTGLTTDEIQKADFALRQSGLSVEDLNTALTRLGDSRRAAVEGNEELRETFVKYGLTLRDLNDPQLRNFDLLQKISGALGNMNLTAREQVELTDLLGKRAGRLANVLKDLATIEPPRTFSQENIEQIDKASKAIEQMKLDLKVMAAMSFENIRDLVDMLAGVHDASGAEAAFPATAGEIQRASAAKRARMEAAEARRNQELFDVDKDKEPEAKKRLDGLLKIAGMLFGAGFDTGDFSAAAAFKKTKDGINSDPFQRIGAFTGASATSAQENLLRDVRMEIQQMRRALETKGILVRGTD